MSEKKSNRPPPRNYFSRREQYRLLLMVMSLGLVILLIVEASKPQNWYWLTGEREVAETEPVDEDYDTTYQPTLPADTEPDTVRIVPNFDPMADEAERYFPGVVPTHLREIEDYAPFRPRETLSWFNLLNVLAKNDTVLINDSSTGPVSFVQLFEQPEVYRGELVSISGSVRRVDWKAASKSQDEIDG